MEGRDESSVAERARRKRAHELLLSESSVELVAHPDEEDEVIQHVYLHDPKGKPLFVGVCARHSEEVLFTLWTQPLPRELIVLDPWPNIEVHRAPEVPPGYPTPQSP